MVYIYIILNIYRRAQRDAFNLSISTIFIEVHIDDINIDGIEKIFT